MEKKNIVVLDGYTLNPGDLSWDALKALGNCTIYDRTSAADVVERCKDADIVLTNKVVIRDAEMAQLPRLRYVGVLATGYNVVDTAAAAARGIVVTNIPAYSTSSVAQMVFAHILNKALNNRMVDPSEIFIDGTHIKASANKKKYQKEQVAKTAKIYQEQLSKEVAAEREALGKKTARKDDDDNEGSGGSSTGETSERKVSTTDPDSGLFVKGEHEKQFAYEAHTVCDRKGFILGVHVTAGNVHDSVAWDALYNNVTERFPEVEYVTMDSAYKTPWIAKKILDDNRIPILPYTRRTGKKDRYRPWDYIYDPAIDSFTCPQGKTLRHTTTTKEGKRVYRSTPKECRGCPCCEKCGANAKGQKVLQTHIWQEYLDLVEQIRKTEAWQNFYARRKETIERAFADAKEKHGMRYTHHRGLARVTSWVRLKFAAMNLKKLAIWSCKTPVFPRSFSCFFHRYAKTLILVF